jgi:hypothetical protein
MKSIAIRARWAGRAIAFIALTGACTAASADEQVTLAQRYAPGKYVLTITMTLDQTAEIHDVSQPAQRNSKPIVADLDVGEPAEDGNRRIEMTFARVVEEQRVGLETAVYDSEGPAELQAAPLARLYDSMLQAKVTITLDASGDVVSVTGLDTLWEDIARQHADTEIGRLAQQMKKQMGDAMIRELFEEGAAMLPKESVGVGDKWNVELDVEIPPLGKIPYRADMKLNSVKAADGDRLAVIEIKGRAKLEERRESEMSGITLVVDEMEYKQTGSVHFWVGKGLPAASSLEQTATIQATVRRPNDQEVPMKINQKIVAATTLVPKAAATQPATTQP